MKIIGKKPAGNKFVFHQNKKSTNPMEMMLFRERIEQKGMTFDHDFCYSFLFSSSLFLKKGREKGKKITKVVVKSHPFLLNLEKDVSEKICFQSLTHINTLTKVQHSSM